MFILIAGYIAMKNILDITLLTCPCFRSGNAGLAKGGTGDVLLGMITSFLGQGLKTFEAACLGVTLHGLAADLAVKKIAKSSLLASDVVAHISAALKMSQ